MKLIVEGPDGAGKSTLIQNLGLKRLHLKSLRGGVGGTTEEGWGGSDEAPLAYVKQLMAAPEGTAFDRFYLSETVYGPLLREGSAITHEETRLVRRVTAARGIGTVICLPPFRRTLGNVKQEGRERPSYQTEKFLREAYISWCRVVTERRAHEPSERYFTHFNYEHHNTVDVMPMLGILQDRVIGSLMSTILVVTADDLDYPALSMHGDSGVLNRAIWGAGIRESEVSFTNARHWDSHLRGVRTALTPMIKAVVAVGLDAAQYMDAVGLNNLVTPHCPLVFSVAPQAELDVLTASFQRIYSCIQES